MTRTAVACPEDDGKPRRKPPGRVPAWKISPMSLERAQTCIRAAELRARSASWKDIAAELGLDSPVEARKCADVGYGLAPGEDLRMARRVSAMRLDTIMSGLWKVVDEPGWATTVTGKLVVVTDPVTGKEGPIPDQQARISAYRALLDADKEYRKLYGADAPRRSVSIVASVEEINAEVERVKAEIAEAERQAAMEAYPDDDGPGEMRALPPGGGS